MSSFGITLRTKVGINEKCVKAFDLWIKKQKYGAYVFEKEGSEKHIHAQIWIEEKRTKGNVMKPLVALLRRCYNPDDFIAKIACVVKPAYNDDFLDEYMQKDGELEYSNPPKDTSPYYPTEEEQAKFMEISESKKNWNMWKELQQFWDQEDRPVHKFGVAKFLAEMMFNKKCIKVEMCPRKRIQMCNTFLAYLQANNDATLFLKKEDHQLYNMMENV